MNTIALDRWLDVIDQQYLDDYVASGGASVKVAVTTDDLRKELMGAVRDRCVRRNFLSLKFDAAERRAHMPQDIFFTMAEQLDWRELARRQILHLADQEAGLIVDGVDPSESTNIYEAIGYANGLPRNAVLRDLRPSLERGIVQNHRMAKDFRVAMAHLCLSENTADPRYYMGEPLLEWLTGRNTRIGNVRHFSVSTPINRNTARYFIESACYWIKHVGFAGTVLQFDISRVTRSRRPNDGSRYYTRAMAMEHYELLREFIDGADRLESTLILAMARPEFLETATDRRSRGFSIYQALQTRIMDDVRDRHLVNPEASLVRLSSQEAD